MQGWVKGPYVLRVSASTFQAVANPFDPDLIRVDLQVTTPAGTNTVSDFFEGADGQVFGTVGDWVGRFYVRAAGAHQARGIDEDARVICRRAGACPRSTPCKTV